VNSTTVDSAAGAAYTEEYDKMHGGTQAAYTGDYSPPYSKHTHDGHQPITVPEEDGSYELRRRVDNGWVEQHPSLNFDTPTATRPGEPFAGAVTPESRYSYDQPTAPYNTETGDVVQQRV